MTRRERIERIVASFSPAWLGRPDDRFIQDLLRRRGMSILTDEAIEELARDLVSDLRRAQRMNRENRKIYAAQQAASTSPTG